MAPDDSSTSAPGTSSRNAAVAALDRVELAVEGAVERATQAAERTAQRHFGHRAVALLGWLFKVAGLLLLFVYFAFALLYLGTRYWVMPHIDDYRPRIEAAVSRVLGTQVTVDRIETGWAGINPHLRLLNMQVRDKGGNVALVLPDLEATLSWTSVPTMAPQFSSIVVRAPELEIRRLPGNVFSVAGFVLDPNAPKSDEPGALEWVLAQRRIAIRDLRLRYVDASVDTEHPAVFDFQDGSFEYRRGLLTHRLAVHARAPSEIAGELDLRMEFRHAPLARSSDFRRWTGQVFLQSDYADIGRLWSMIRQPAAGFDLRQGQGAVRTWIKFDQTHVQRLAADVALADVDVRLARDRAPLLLAGVQGRVVLNEVGGGAFKGGQELALTRFSLVAPDGLAIPETDLQLRVAPLADVFDLGNPAETDARRGELTTSRMRVETLARLAEHAPMRADLHTLLVERNLRGELFDTQITWNRPPQQDAPLRYTVQTRFAGLSSRSKEADPPTTKNGTPRPGLPGFENLAGTLTANEAGGKVRVEADDAVLEFPGVMETLRVPATHLRLAAGWATQPRLELRFDSVQLTNADAELTGSGLWRATKGPGYLDVSAHVARLSAPAAAKYAPLVLGNTVRNWLHVGLTAGEAVDGNVRLRGELAEFPFTNGNGEFVATTRIRGAGVDYLPPALLQTDPVLKTRWPAVANVDGDLRFERNTMHFAGQRGTFFDTRLERIDLRFPELVTKDPRILLSLTAIGPAPDVVRFVNTTPVGGWLGNFLAETRAEGAATTELKLDIPLREPKESKVAGTVALAGVDISLFNDLPPFAAANGRIEFTESGFKLTNIAAGFAGGQLTVDGGSRPDGPIVITGNGTTTPAGIRRLTDLGIVHRALDKAQGTTRYAGTLTVRGGRTELHVESNLAGWTLDLPPPLQKTVTEEWPTRFDIVPQVEAGGARADRVRLFVANKLAVQVARRAERSEKGALLRAVGSVVRVGRGTDADVDAVGEGLRVVVDLPRLDVDRWTPFFTAAAPGAGAAERPTSPPGSDLPNLVAARVDELVYAGKPMANVVIGATRAAEGDDVVWLANVVSDNGTGSVNWKMPRGDSPGRVSARLARLLIPESDRSEVTEVFDAPAEEVAPALDIVVDSFELGTIKLGRLELQAQNTAPGVAGEWQLQKLDISNPDAHMKGTGRWYREPNARRRTMALDMSLAFNNAGRLLARFGIPNALKNGEGTLDAKLSWRGGPLSLDYPTLAGSLKLAATKGQFLKADAGAGRLLGVLSLQALPRRMTTLDFRDVFSEGFAFDSINSTADVAAGVLSTRDFKMRSPNASVLIEGSSDLRAETQNLHVLVLPEVSATSASLVYALLANPAIGLGTFIAQLLLKDPLSKAFSFEYDVIGTWRDPVVRRRERAAPASTGDVAPGQDVPAQPSPQAPPAAPSPASPPVSPPASPPTPPSQ